MQRSVLTRQRLIGIFLVGILLLCSPALTIFDHATTWHGYPVSFLYLFGAWLLLVVLAALAVEGGDR